MIARVVALTVVAAVCGCGGGAEDDEAGEPAITPTPTPVEVEIDEPLNGASVVAREEIAFRLVARVDVTGRAAPGAALLLRTTCRDADCTKPVHAGPRGRFRAVATVWSREGHTGGTIVVGVAGSAPTTHERVVVRLLPPRERREPKQPREREPEAPEAVATPTPSPPRTLVMIGDSLAQGTEPYLAGLLDGWQVRTDARRGRPLAEGMGVLDATSTPSPAVLAFSLFTNDSPTSGDALEAAVRRSVQRAGPGGCAVWATIVRPPLSGVSYDAANRRLNALAADPELAGRLVVVPWAEAVARDPRLIAADGVHGTTAGYQTRARLYASAARACGG